MGHFKTTIHEQTLPEVAKFSYLKSVLKGSVLSTIAGIPLTSENYTLVIKLLQDRFGRQEAIVESLYSKLQNLPKTGKKLAEVQHMCETTEKLLQQLEAQGEYISEQRILIQQIISKYLTEVITKLEESKEPGTPWTTKSLRKSICHYITVKENVQHHVSNGNLKVKGRPFVSKQTRPLTGSHRSSTEVFAVNSQVGSSASQGITTMYLL